MHRITPWLMALALGALGAATSAWAQTRYLEADPARAAAEGEIRVRLMSGEPFGAGELPGADLRHVRLERLWRSGRVELEPDDATGMARLVPSEPGVQLIAYRPRERGQGSGGVESFGKALVVAGPASRGEQIWRSELGQALEIVPGTDPVALAESGGTLEVQVLFGREPLAGATVVAIAEGSEAASYRRSVTDTFGRARFDLDRPGRWLVHLVHKGPARSGEPGWVLYQSSLVLVAGSPS